MPPQPEKHEHPGTYIRTHVIPPGMSVTHAAELLNVGRPALSNLLNTRSGTCQRLRNLSMTLRH